MEQIIREIIDTIRGIFRPEQPRPAPVPVRVRVRRLARPAPLALAVLAPLTLLAARRRSQRNGQ